MVIWERLKGAWRSLMAERGTILIKAKQPRDPVLVLSSCRFGLIVWPLVGARHQKLTWFRMAEPTAEVPRPWRCLHLVDTSQYLAYPSTAVPLIDCVKVSSSPSVPTGLLVQGVGKPVAVEVHAAMFGFRGMTVAWMTKLYDSAEVGAGRIGRKPTRELDITKALVQFYLPQKSEEEIVAIVALRGKSMPEESEDPSALAEPAFSSTVANIVDDNDKSEFEKITKSRGPKSTSTAASSSHASAATQAAPGGARPPREPERRPRPVRPPLLLPSVLTREWALEHIPKAKGCTISLETKRYGRWCGEYLSKPSPPRHCTKVFGEESSTTRADAFLHVCRWLWAAHHGATGQECPFNLDAVVGQAP